MKYKTQTASEKRKPLWSMPAGRVKLAVFFLILFLNILTVKTSDDLGYSINNGLFDIINREYIQYMTWTGRTVAHLIARVFLALPKGIFNVFNALIFCVETELIAKHAAGPNRLVSGKLFALCALAVFLFVPVFGQTVLWETGSCNYLWTTAIVLSFLYVYRKETEAETAHKPWFAAAFFFWGVAAGWTNENTGGACILMVLIFLLLFRMEKKAIKPWMITGLIGAVIGFLFMIKAPGNAVRAADFVNEGGRAYVLVHDLRNTLNVFGKPETQLPLWLAFGVCLALLLRKGNPKTNTILGCAYAVCGMAAVYAIVLSPVPVEFDRSMFGATVFVIIGVITLACELTEQHSERGASVSTAALGLMIVLSCVRYGHAVLDLGYTSYQYYNRESWVASQKNAGNVNPVVPQINSEFFTTYNAMYGLNDILDYPGFVNNENYALTHGLESVVSTTLDKWNQLYKNGDPALMNTLDFETYVSAVQADQNYTAFVTTTALNDTYEMYTDILAQTVGKTDLAGHSNFILKLGAESSADVRDESFGKEESVDGHYVWIYSSDDPATSDILIDGNEYTNDQEGVTIVVFDRERGEAVDAVTWNRDYGTRGIRSYTEK